MFCLAHFPRELSRFRFSHQIDSLQITVRLANDKSLGLMVFKICVIPEQERATSNSLVRESYQYTHTRYHPDCIGGNHSTTQCLRWPLVLKIRHKFVVISQGWGIISCETSLNQNVLGMRGQLDARWLKQLRNRAKRPNLVRSFEWSYFDLSLREISLILVDRAFCFWSDHVLMTLCSSFPLCWYDYCSVFHIGYTMLSIMHPTVVLSATKNIMPVMTYLPPTQSLICLRSLTSIDGRNQFSSTTNVSYDNKPLQDNNNGPKDAEKNYTLIQETNRSIIYGTVLDRLSFGAR